MHLMVLTSKKICSFVWAPAIRMNLVFTSISFSIQYIPHQTSCRQADTGDTSAWLPRYFRTSDLYTSCEQWMPVRANGRDMPQLSCRDTHTWRISAWVINPRWQSLLMPWFHDMEECVGVRQRWSWDLARYYGWDGGLSHTCHCQGCEYFKRWRTACVKEDATTHSLLTLQLSKWCH